MILTEALGNQVLIGVGIIIGLTAVVLLLFLNFVSKSKK